MKIKKVLCVFCLVLCLLLASVFDVKAKDGKVLELTLPSEFTTYSDYMSNYIVYLTGKEYKIQSLITDSMNENIFYNPTTNQPLFQKNTSEGGYYFNYSPYEGTTENDFIFDIPEEWYNIEVSDGIVVGDEYTKIKINFAAITPETVSEITFDFSKMKSVYDFPLAFEGIASLWERNENYPITVSLDDNNNVINFIERETSKVLATINLETFVVSVSDVASYEDNMTFEMEEINTKVSLIFGNNTEGEILEITLPLEETNVDDYLENLSLRESLIFRKYFSNLDVFYNPKTNNSLFEMHSSNNSFYTSPNKNIDDSEFTFAIPWSWYSAFTNDGFPNVLDGYNRIKINFKSVPLEPTTEIIVDFTKYKNMYDLSSSINDIINHLIDNDDYPIIALANENGEIKLVKRDTNKVLAVINKDDYSITIPGDVGYDDNISFNLALNEGSEQIKLSFIFDSTQNGNVNPATYKNVIALLILCGCIISIANLFKVRKKSK